MPFFSRGKTHRLGVRVARLPSRHNNSIRIKVRIQSIQGFQALRPKEGSSPIPGELSVRVARLPSNKLTVLHLHQHHH